MRGKVAIETGIAVGRGAEHIALGVEAEAPGVVAELVQEGDGLPVASEAVHALAELVALQPQPAELSRELNCLAAAIYHESKGETLAGQLAVGRVIVARSGRRQ